MNLNDIVKNTLCEEMSYSSYDNYDSFKYENEIAFYNDDDESLFEMLENELNNKSEVIEMKNECNANQVVNNNEGSVNMNNNMNEMMMNMMSQMQALMEQNAKLQAQVNDLMSAKAPQGVVASQTPVAPVAPVAPLKPSVGCEESRVQVDNHNATIDRSRFAESRVIADMSKVDYRSLNDEQKNNILSDIKDKLFSALNPNYYVDILAEYDSDILQAYYTRLLVIAGQYSPEADNVDS